MSTLNVALIQSELHWHDAQRNRARFDRLFEELSAPCDLIVLPEMFSTGFTMSSKTQAEVMSGPTLSWMKASAARLSAVVCGSIIVEEGGAFYNRFIWAQSDGGLCTYDKRHLFRMADEHRHYCAGGERTLLELRGFRVFPQVCYDLRFPVFSRNRGDYDLAIYVANWPASRALAWNALLRARAIENQCYVVGVNRIGTDGNAVDYVGDSAVFAFDGTSLLAAGSAGGVFRVALDLDALRAYREEFPAWRDADEFDISLGGERE